VFAVLVLDRPPRRQSSRRRWTAPRFAPGLVLLSKARVCGRREPFNEAELEALAPLDLQPFGLDLAEGMAQEVLSDFLGAAAVIVAAVVIAVTGLQRADPVASLVIGVLIIPRTWQLLRQATDVLLEATPKNVDLGEVRRHMLATHGVIDVHDLHAWTITSGVDVLSAHVVVSAQELGGPVLDQLGGCMSDHFDIEHSTFQIEPPGHRDHEPILHR
jgi:Cation efflux family